ncbi:TPA: putative 2-aminoethylphosphonate ABC transporter permease subunit, partial [Vibrio cholerae]
MLNVARTFSVRILPHWSRDSLILSTTLLILLSLMLLFIVAPLAAMLLKSVQNGQGEFVGLAYFAQYFSSAALWQSLRNTLVLGISVTAIVG